MGKNKIFSIVSIAFVTLGGLKTFYEFQDTSQRTYKDIQPIVKKFSTLSKSDKDKIGVLGVGIIIGIIGTSVIRK